MSLGRDDFLGKLSPSSVVFSFFYLLGCFSSPQVFCIGTYGEGNASNDMLPLSPLQSINNKYDNLN